MNDIWIISLWSYDSFEDEKRSNHEIAVPKRWRSASILYDFCFITAIRRVSAVLTVVVVHVHLHFEASHMVSIE